MAKKITMKCGKCGGSDVSRDASAIWDDKSQEWTLGGVQDQAYCDDCGETDLEEVEIEG